MAVLSWTQIHANAIKFSNDWKDAHYEKGETQSFYNDFFEVFGHRARNVVMYERKIEMVGRSHGFIDLFWPSMLIVEQKSAGKDLQKASIQADDYILALKEQERPRYKLISDFQNFELTDLENRKTYSFSLSELSENIRLFDFIAGRRQQIYKDQDPVNIDASDKMSNLHKVLEESGYDGTDLEKFLVRVMFCLFSDDTGIFEQDILLKYIRERTNEDGSDVGGKLIELFQVLDTPIEKRQKTLDVDLQAFPYVNGKLFHDLIRTPSFNAEMRDVLLECCYFNWTKVSPALFGSLFQTVMLPLKQRQSGAHYTSEKNILKTIQPLFLDELYEKFEKIKRSKGIIKHSKLEQFQKYLSKLTFFDPACGCGNFLILAYRELRLLELEILKELYPDNGQFLLDVDHLSKINVDQFYGIEMNEFPVHIAQTALWLVDHQMNMKLGDLFGQAYARLPLDKSANIHHGNALRIDWNTIIPAQKCSYILGNPPFIGKQNRSKEQTQDLLSVFEDIKRSKELDYVSCWFYKASFFIQNSKCIVALVSTNSIVQGEQVYILWEPILNELNCTIHFAHKTFKWTIDEQKSKQMKVASVYCVIIGFGCFKTDSKYIFEYEKLKSDPHRMSVNNISPYLIDIPSVLIPSRMKPIKNGPLMKYGSKPVDNRNFLFTEKEKEIFIKHEPNSADLFKPCLSANEFLNGKMRYCLWLKDIDPNVLIKLPKVKERIEAVKAFRQKSHKKQTQKAANIPWEFAEIRQPKEKFIIIPSTTSEFRHYIPFGFFDSNFIVTNSCQALLNANLFHLGIISTTMHMAWVKTVAGRLKGDYRYSNLLVYNNFPWPEVTQKQEKEISEKAQKILEARENHKDSTLAELYNPLLMPKDLRKAHNDLDKAVDKAYRKNPFQNERERIKFLFQKYEQMTNNI